MNTVEMSAGVIDGGQFETVHYPDDEVRLRVTQHGNVQVTEYISTDREGPPAHYHQWDEVEFVIEGEVEFYQNGTWTRGGPGIVQMLPAGIAHSVRVPAGTARLIMITIGALFDSFSRELSATYASGTAGVAEIVQVANRHGVRLEGDRHAGVGYPPGVTEPSAMKEKITTSIQKWMNQAQKKPRVSSMALPFSQPGMKAIMQPRMPYGTP